MENSSSWTTQDEIDYLNFIGTHGNFRPEHRRELLEGYAEALKYRPRCRYLDMRRLKFRVDELLNEGSTH